MTDGEGTLAAGARTQRLTKGDVLVVPAGTAQSFTSVAPSISYLLITVPVLATGAKAEVVYADHDKVAATMKKAGPLADGPNLRVSGGYRTDPYVPADNRPTVEIHANEADLFYVIEGRATQVLGGDSRRRQGDRRRDRFADRRSTAGRPISSAKGTSCGFPPACRTGFRKSPSRSAICW